MRRLRRAGARHSVVPSSAWPQWGVRLWGRGTGGQARPPGARALRNARGDARRPGAPRHHHEGPAYGWRHLGKRAKRSYSSCACGFWENFADKAACCKCVAAHEVVLGLRRAARPM